MLKNLFVIACVLTAINLTATAAEDSDNSKKNKAQVQNNELDARHQSNDKADVEITTKIRKNVVGEKSFSTNAKNVKIITIGGNVTLKGPVNSLDEKTKIHAIATQIAGAGHVTDEIEIKTK